MKPYEAVFTFDPPTQKSLYVHNYIYKHVHVYSGVFYIEIVDVLLDHDALVKAKNADGWIPLDEAISYGNREMSEATCYGYNRLL